MSSNLSGRFCERSSFNERLDRHFLVCSAFVGTAALLAGGNEAEGAIIYSGLQNQDVINGSTGIYIDLEMGAGITNIIVPPGPGAGRGMMPGWDMNFYIYGGTTLGLGIPFNSFGVVGSGSNAVVLTGGTQIDSLSAFISGPAFANGTYPNMLPNWNNASGFLGISFTDSGANRRYGWVRLTTGANGLPATVVDWAYDDSGAGIVAGAVPEPGSMALGCLAAGALGVVAWRKRRKA